MVYTWLYGCLADVNELWYYVYININQLIKLMKNMTYYS